MHPEVADDYREARRFRAGIIGRSTGNESGDDNSTEEMRQSLRRYRSVYERLVEG